MTTYEVVLSVEEDHLPAIIGVVKGSAIILRVTPVNDPKPSKKIFYAGGKRLKGVTGEELIKQVVKDGNVHEVGEFEKAFGEHNFAKSSVASTLSKAVHSKILEKVGPSLYCKLGALVHKGGAK